MPDIERLHLEDCLDDTPQSRAILSVFENDAQLLRQYTIGLHNCCQRIVSAQAELTVAFQEMSHRLRVYGKQRFPLEAENSILSATLKQFANYFDEVSSWYQTFNSQLQDGFLFPLSRFLDADLEEVVTLKEMFDHSTSDYDQSVTKYSKVNKKNDRAKIETNEEVYAARKNFHKTGLHYFASLNGLQYKRKFGLLEPMLGLLHAQKTFFRGGQENLANPEVDIFVNNISLSVQSVHQEINTVSGRDLALIQVLEEQSEHKYYAEPRTDMPQIPPNLTLMHKAGYLFLKGSVDLLGSKFTLLTRWERLFFFIQGDNLMVQKRDELAGRLMFFISPDVTVFPAEVEERRFVFQINIASQKKSIVVQAENDRERQEWIAVIQNVIKHSGKHDDNTAHSGRLHSTSLNDLQRAMHAVEVPIQFDLMSPSRSKKLPEVEERTGTEKPRVDSFVAGASFAELHITRFIGSMEVRSDRGEALIHDTIRQIMAARAIHNILRMSEVYLVVTDQFIRVIDPGSRASLIEFQLEDIPFWAANKDNERIFGLIFRDRLATKFYCYVFESYSTGKEVTSSVSTATQVAYQEKMARNELSAEMKLLLDNIEALPDKPLNPTYMTLEPDAPDTGQGGRHVPTAESDA